MNLLSNISSNQKLHFLFDCLMSLLNWKILHIKRNNITNYKINSQLYSLRKYSMDSMVIFENILLNIYNPYLPDFKPNDIIIDIGAHIGSFAIPLARKYPHLKILCFEPEKENYFLLRKNVRQNNINNLIIFNKAVSSRSGYKYIHIDPSNTGGNSVYPILNAPNKFKISSMSLKSVFDTNNISSCRLLKLDCEGCEYEILKNTPQKIFNKIQLIITETHSQYDVKDLIKLLKKYGYRVNTTQGLNNLPYAKLFNIPILIAVKK